MTLPSEGELLIGDGVTHRNNGLSSVSCPTVATCTAVGNYGRTGSVKTLIETGT